MMETAAYVAGSAVVARTVVEWLKDKKYTAALLSSSLSKIIASVIVNFVLALGWAVLDGAPLNVVLTRAIGQVALAAVYNDWKKAVTF